MSKEAGLPMHHTNHCVRATSCTVNTYTGIQDKDIIKLTSNKYANSLKRYIDRAPTSKKRVHIGILASAMQGTTDLFTVVKICSWPGPV